MENLYGSLIVRWMMKKVSDGYNYEYKFRLFIEKLLIKTNILKGDITQKTISKVEGTILGVIGFIIFYGLIITTKSIIKY